MSENGTTPSLPESQRARAWMLRSPTLERRFWSKVKIGPGCWEWQAARNAKSGYGVIGVCGHVIDSAHRVMWMLVFGSIPEGAHLMHHCDNPACVRPSHLSLGTHEDNIRDARDKGLLHHGATHRWAKLKPDQIIEIRARFAAGETQRSIAEDYGTTRANISAITVGRTWRIV